jgi:hypothetical protein
MLEIPTQFADTFSYKCRIFSLCILTSRLFWFILILCETIDDADNTIQM